MDDSVFGTMAEQTAEKPKLTEQDFNLITQARDDFNSKSYEQCWNTLNQLEESMGASARILHNKAVLEFYKSGCKDYKTLHNFLLHELDEIQRKTGETRFKNVAAPIYNKAVILFLLGQYFPALEQLTPLVERLQDLDESLAPRAGLLMIQLLLSTTQYTQALHFLKSFQDQLGISLETIAADENTFPESLSSIDGFKRMFKLLTLLTNVVNKKIVSVPHDGSAEFAVLKARQFYESKDFQKASKELSQHFPTLSFTVKDHGEDLDTCVANNMGVIHLRARHYAIGARFLQEAFRFDNKVSGDSKNGPLHSILATRKPDIYYNLGVAMLNLNRPQEAFECFLVPLNFYHNNPRLWFRLAEACIMLHEKTVKEKEQKNLIAATIGSGMHRKHLLVPSAKATTKRAQSFAIPNPTLEFAALCLRNAVYLLEHTTIFDKKSKLGEEDSECWKDVCDEKLCHPSMALSRESYRQLTAYVYAANAYVLVRLGDYKVALTYAFRVLLRDDISDALRMTVSIYCAEAGVNLNRIGFARKNLDPNFIKNMKAQDFEIHGWEINSVQAAQSVMRYNLAVTLVLQGEMDLAKALLYTCVHPIVSTKVKMLKMYLEISTGSAENKTQKVGT